jgi:hypothetical protein
MGVLPKVLSVLLTQYFQVFTYFAIITSTEDHGSTIHTFPRVLHISGLDLNTVLWSIRVLLQNIPDSEGIPITAYFLRHAPNIEINTVP